MTQPIANMQPFTYSWVENGATRNSQSTSHYQAGVEGFKAWLSFNNAPSRAEATNEEIQELIYAAEEADQANAENLTEPTSNGFEPYSLRLKDISCLFTEGSGVASGEIYSLAGRAYEKEGDKIPVTEGYTAQVGESLILLESEDERKNEQHRMIMELTGLGRGMLYAIAALGNQLVFRAASACGVLQRTEHGQAYVSGPKAARRFVEAQHRIWNPIGATVTAAKQFWSEVNISGSRASVKRVSEWLRARGYLDFDGAFKEGLWGKGREYFGIDMVRLLLLLECVERLLGGYKALPRHRMSFVQKLFNAVFVGREYGRGDKSDADLSWRDRTGIDSITNYAIWSRSEALEDRLKAFAERIEAQYGKANSTVQRAWALWDELKEQASMELLKKEFGEGV